MMEMNEGDTIVLPAIRGEGRDGKQAKREIVMIIVPRQRTFKGKTAVKVKERMRRQCILGKRMTGGERAKYHEQ